VKVHVPVHVTPDWVVSDLSRKLPGPGKTVSRAKDKYIKGKHLSIRQYIARAEQVK
jgi:hypothetical protein